MGELEVKTCGQCGHGWLSELAPDNEHFESDVYRSWRESMRVTMEARADRYVTDFLRLSGVAPRTVVEVGCATGETVARFVAEGARAWGVDTSVTAIDVARSTYPEGSFEVAQMPDAGEPASLALMMHVIEHVPDPVATMSALHDLVETDGFLYLRLPNFGGSAARTLRGAWPDFMADHVHYFTISSMQKALAASGWREVKIETAAASWPWLGGLKRVVRRSRPALAASGHGSPPSQRQMRVLERSDRVLAPFLRAEARRGQGNEMIVVARRS